MSSRPRLLPRKSGLPARAVLAGLICALLAGLIGPAARNEVPGPTDAENRLAAAMALSPRQKDGSAADYEDGPGGVPNQAAAKSLQSKYPAISGGADAKKTNQVKVEAGPVTVKGFDGATSRELPDRRTPKERTYLNADGTHTTEFGRDEINYRLPDGSFQPIDTTIVPERGKPGWHNAADRVGLGFAPTAAGTVVDVKLDDQHRFGYSVDGADGVAGQVSGSSVTYPAVRTESDLRLDVLPGGVKETLVLKSPKAPHSWVFPLRLLGLTPSLVDGRVILRDAAGAERAQIPAGFMTDARRDPKIGDFTTSQGVSYRLIDQHGTPALQMDLDEAWLGDPARQYPVQVDPSVDTSAANTGMVVQNGSRLDGGSELKAGTTGSLKAASYLGFDGVQDRLRNHKILGAQLSLLDMWSWSCQPRPVTVHAVTSPWGTSGGFPGPSYGPALAQESFAHGYIGLSQHASSCPSATEVIPLGVAGRDLVQRWVTGAQPNYGLTVRASDNDAFGWKKFAGNHSANPPRLFVTHSEYDAEYRVDRGVPEPPITRTEGGKVKITVTNRGADTWRAADFALGYRAFTTKGTPVAALEAASLPADVPRGGSVTLDAFIKPLDPGDYLLDFSMLRRGGAWFTDEQIPPTRLVMNVFDVPPVVKAQYPPNGYSAQTLTPQLWVDAVDVDAPVNSALKYRFEVCERYDPRPDGSLAGVSCVDSGYVGKRTWNVPVGALRWSKDYQWRAFAYDGVSESEKLTPSHLLTAVPQPEITSHLANAPYTGAQKDFDAQTGNYFSAAIDASVVTTGPPLTVTRTYNSLDPRSDLTFGAGWSTQYDMRVVPDADSSGNVVVTYPDGQQARFGRNADGSFAAPPGRQANFRTEVEGNGGGWVLTDQAATLYRFRPDGRLIATYDQAGHYVELDYGTPEHLKRAISRTSDRILYFTWTGNHVTSVSTDPVNGKQLTWTYSYTGDKLTKVCDPVGGCTAYEHVSGSHYRSSVVDARPSSYWRLGEASGTVAASQSGTKLGKDNGTYQDVALGQAGPLANAADTAAGFNGTSSVVTLPDGMIRKNRDLAVELWFKTTQGGPLFGYEKTPLTGAPASATPVLYVGTDGKLRGQFANGAVAPITSAAAVNNDQWHHVVLSGSVAAQTLYLDGQQVGTAQGEIDHSDMVYNQIGAAYAVPASAWPAWGTTPRRSFSGQIDEVAQYEYPVGPTAAMAHFQARAGADYLAKITLPSGRIAAQLSYDTTADRLRELTDRQGGVWKLGTPVVTGAEGNLVRSTQVSDPGNRPHFYDFDPVRGRVLRYVAPLGQGIRQEDRRDPVGNVPPPTTPGCDPSVPPQPGDPSYCGGPVNGGGPWVGGPVTGLGVRTYDYDTQGFQITSGDELGNQTVLTRDERGNVLSRKTCRIAPGNCQTSYSSYYYNSANPIDPRNDKLISSRDARSADATDPKYVTTFTYTGVGLAGFLESVTAPDQGVLRYSYTVGTEAAVGGGNAPAGLIAQTTDARGGITRYSYYRNGDLAKTVDPAGLTTVLTYDVLGRKAVETQTSDSYPAGLSTTYAYDELSRPTATTSPGAKNPVTGVVHTARTVTGYDPDGNVTRVETVDLTGGDANRVTSTGYDERGLRNQVVDAEGRATYYGNDVSGNTTWMTDPAGNKYEYAYTARNAIAEVRLRGWHGNAVEPDEGRNDGEGGGDPDAAARPSLILSSYGYDLAGRLVRETDASGRTTRYLHYNDNKVYRVVAAGLADPANPAAPKRDLVLDEFTYDGAGRVVKDVSAGNRVTAYEYDAVGRQTAEVLDPAGLANRTETTYSPGGDVTKLTRTGASSNSTRLDVGRIDTLKFGYDTAGRRVREAVVNGGSAELTTTHTYDQRGLATSTTDPRGSAAGADPAAFTTAYSYDPLGRLSATTGAPVAVERDGGQPAKVATQAVTGYNTFGEPTANRDPNGEVRAVTYDKLGRVTDTLSPDYCKPGDTTATKALTHVRYDPLGNTAAVTDPRGATTRYRYDQLGRQVERIDPKPDAGDQPGGVWRYSFTNTGEQLSLTDPTGSRTEATYDDLGRQVTATQLERQPQPAAYTTKLRYDDAGQLTSVASPTGEITRHTYDALGERVSTTDGAGVVSRFGYDIAGHQTRTSDGLGRTTYRVFDTAGRNTSLYDLDTAEHVIRRGSAAYDPAGNQISKTDPYGRVTRSGYDNQNRLVQQVEPVSDTETITTSFGYDAAGRLTRTTDGRGNPTVQTYNPLGLPESVIEPATAAQPSAADRTWVTSYDLAGHPAALQAPGGVTRQRTYDALGRLTAETGAGAAEPTTARAQRFDAAGRLLAVSAPGGEKTFSYNDRGALLSSAAPATGTSTYAYDQAGRLSGRTDAAGTASFSYKQGRLDTQSDGLTGVTQTLGYDQAGAVATVNYGGGQVRKYGYDDYGRMTGETLTGAGDTTIASAGYGYDLNDRLTGKTTAGTAGAGASSYGYDQSGRLTSSTANGKTTAYGWDASGNRTKAGDKTATFDERNRQLTDGADTLSWSPRGTLDSRTTPQGTTKSGFDAFDRVVKQGDVSYGYDGLNRMATRNGQSLAYDGTGLNLITDGSSAFSRGASGELLAQKSGNAQLALTDQHQDVVGGFDPVSGALTGSAAFDPFGGKTAGSGTLSSLGFQSDFTDPSTGAVDMGARQYTPGTGTFTARDDVALPVTPSVMANRYTYAGGSPADRIDVDGHGWLDDIIGAVDPGGICDGYTFYYWVCMGTVLYMPHVTEYGPGDIRNPVYSTPLVPRGFDWGNGEGPVPGSGGKKPGAPKKCQSVKAGCGGGKSTPRVKPHLPPPPPPPGIKARKDARDKALRVADPIPVGASGVHYADPTSSNPNLPATKVSDTKDGLQTAFGVFQVFRDLIRGPNGEVMQDMDALPASELAQQAGWEVFYRAMSYEEFESFKKNGIQPKHLESFMTQDAEYIQGRIPKFKRGKYDVVVTMYTRPGTRQLLVESGAIDHPPSDLLESNGLGGLPRVQPGNANQVHIKSEHGYLTYGIRSKDGQGSAQVYNGQILGYTVDTLKDFGG